MTHAPHELERWQSIALIALAKQRQEVMEQFLAPIDKAIAESIEQYAAAAGLPGDRRWVGQQYGLTVVLLDAGPLDPTQEAGQVPTGSVSAELAEATDIPGEVKRSEPEPLPEVPQEPETEPDAGEPAELEQQNGRREQDVQGTEFQTRASRSRVLCAYDHIGIGPSPVHARGGTRAAAADGHTHRDQHRDTQADTHAHSHSDRETGANSDRDQHSDTEAKRHTEADQHSYG